MDERPSFDSSDTGVLADHQRMDECPVVIRGRRLDPGREGSKYAWTEVEVFRVLRNDSLQTLPDRISVVYSVTDEGPPHQVCTMYLSPYGGAWVLLGGTAEKGVSHVWAGPEVNYDECSLWILSYGVILRPQPATVFWSGHDYEPEGEYAIRPDFELTADEMRDVVTIIEDRLCPEEWPAMAGYCALVQSEGRSYWADLGRSDFEAVEVLNEMIRALPAEKATGLTNIVTGIETLPYRLRSGE